MLIVSCFKSYHLSFIAKKDAFILPLINRYMFNYCFLPLDRDDSRQGLMVINKSVEYISNNQNSIGVFPEGTRNKSNTIKDIKAGSFKIATKSKCPIVVACINNTIKISKRWPFRTKIDIKTCDVLYYENYKLLDTSSIACLAKDIIQNNLDEIRKNK